MGDDNAAALQTDKAARRTVLVVDDDTVVRDTLRVAFEEKGYLVLMVRAHAALAIAHALRPDLILMDIDRPAKVAEQVIHQLRANPATAPIPLIGMCTACQWDNLIAHVPMDARLPKPFDLQELYRLVARWTQAA